MAYSDPPTSKQLDLLRRLAGQTGQTFAWPADRRAASAEIARLKSSGRSSRHERAEDRHAVQAARRGDNAAVLESEIEGYGGHARWRGGRR